jgi:hypothetical protein
METIVLTLIYILSVIGNRWIYRLFSYKHYNLWPAKYCKASLSWFIPAFNTICFIIHVVILITDDDVNFIKLPKSKFLNTDL